MAHPRVVIAVAGDPGGASAVAPVISRLRSCGRRVVALGYRQARSVWTDRRISYEDLPEYTDADAAGRYMETLQADVLLTATSFNGVDLEKRFLQAAAAQGVPSMAVLDFWSNYRVRFADDQNGLAYLPDRIGVMDEHARQEMLADGFDASRLFVTGQPAFDELATVRQRGFAQDRTELRRSLGLGEKERLVLFASQPLAELYGTDGANALYPGYTQRSVLDSLVEALDRTAERTYEQIMLLIRPHPREQTETLHALRGRRTRVVVDGHTNRHQIVLAADLVVGMNTVLLVEACLLGCVVLSLQPCLRFPDALPTNRWGASRAVYQEENIEPALVSLLFDPSVRQGLLARCGSIDFRPDAAERVVSVLEELMAIRHSINEEKS